MRNLMSDCRVTILTSIATNTPDTRLAGAIAQLPVSAAAAQDRFSEDYLASTLIVNRATSVASSAAAVPALVTDLQHIYVINAQDKHMP